MTYATGGPYIVCEDLFKIYKIADLEVVALRGLDLNIDAGEIMAIVGASGSGKTTLLNILAGYDAPSAGKVTVGGKALLNLTAGEVIKYRREEVGFVWQQPSRNLFPYLSAIENVELPIMLTGRSSSYRHTLARELIELVGLKERMNHTPERLSGGEQQRVAIAVALANRPPLLLTDEPTGELDDETAGEIMDVLYRVNHELSTTIVIVTHDPRISHKVNRVVAIRDGKTSSEVLRKVSFKPSADARAEEEVLEEFYLIDGSGRVQIPKEYLNALNIKGRARISLKDGEVVLQPEEKRRE